MSRSPQNEKTLSGRHAFEEAQALLDEMIFEGFSFSGNEPNCGFLNLGERGFATVSSAAGLDFRDDGRAVGVVDWDQDGDLDLWLQNRTGPQLRFLRNESPPVAGWIAVRLEGTRSNRDAIGARLELHLPEEPPLVRSMRAGDGFLTQSSRWIHFGLGGAEKIDRLVVHWPSGLRQEFRELKVGVRYRIVEGDPTARRLRLPQRVLHLRPAELPASRGSEQSRTVMAAPPPLPNLEYEDFNGGLRSLPPSKSPLLLNLWASWCSPCVAELREFQLKAPELKERGLNLLALSVDGLGDDGSSPQAARLFAEKLGLEFPVGMATRTLLDKLEILHHRLMDWRRPFPVPTSFLVDAQGRLAAIYRGAVSVDQALNDLSLAGAFRKAAPFPGRWSLDAPELALSHLAQGFLDKGYLDEAERYLAMARTEMERRPQLRDPNYGSTRNALGVKLMEAGRQDEAQSQLREALRVDPKSPRAHANLGILYASAGRYDQALSHFEKALENAPEDSEALSNLGVALMQAGRLDDSVLYLERALAVDAGLAKTHFTLGLAQTKQKRISEAIESYRKALAADPSLGEAAAALSWILATHPDAAVRKGEEALLLARRAVSSAAQPSADLLDVLAAALAENGRFGEAVAQAEQALQLARLEGKPDLVRAIEERKKVYQTEKAFRAHP